MSSEERNGEIWANRVQKELLALTTDNADMHSTEERSMIPSYTTIKDHKLDLGSGSCFVNVHVDIPQEGGNKAVVIITLNASLHTNADGSINTSKPSYPFMAPTATLADGAEFFPKGSTIKNGDTIAMDLDWTPSLHLTDVILNIGLKIKESVLQKEPFHPAPPAETPSSGKRFGFGFNKGAVSKAFSFNRQQPSPGTSATPESAAKSRAMNKGLKIRTSGTAGPPGVPRKSPSANKPIVASTIKSAAAAKPATPSTPGNVKIGDEINLLEEPWVNAHGVYSCKAIRRPPFIEEVMETAAKKLDKANNEGFSSPTAMLRNFAQQTRSLMEESFLMVTETHIIELKASRLNVSSGTVAFCIPIEMMAKLKFRRQESLSLFFKTAPNDPLVYMCPDSGDAVHQIQSVLKRHGVRGKHTNAAAYKAISEAMHLVQAIQTKELALKHDPTVERVNEIMDLYRQAAERFEIAGDIRHEEVVTHMRKFLALPQTVSILDGSFKKPDDSPRSKPKRMLSGGIPEGEIIEPVGAHLFYDNDDTEFLTDDGVRQMEKMHEKISKEDTDNDDKAFEQNIDNLLKDARADFCKLGSADDDHGTLETDAPSAGSSIGDELADVAADLDAMMREADREFQELMSS